MDIRYRDTLNKEESESLLRLVRECNLHDGTHYSAPCDADIFALLYEENKATVGSRLLAAVCLYHMGATENRLLMDEVSAFTLPEKRKCGLFSELLAFLRPVIRGGLSFPVYESCADTLSVLAALKAEKSHDEYFMEKELSEGLPNSLPEARPESLPDIAPFPVSFERSSENELCFHSRSCECSVMRYSDDSCYLYGMLTYSRFLNKGCGFLFLNEVLNILSGDPRKELPEGFSSPAKKVILQVSSLNIPAVKLYKKCGFSIKDSLSFYKLLSLP